MKAKEKRIKKTLIDASLFRSVICMLLWRRRVISVFDVDTGSSYFEIATMVGILGAFAFSDYFEQLETA